MDAAAVRPDALVRDRLASLCLLALAAAGRDAGMLDAAAEAGALDRLAEVVDGYAGACPAPGSIGA